MEIIEIAEKSVLVFEITWIQTEKDRTIMPTYYTNQQLRKYDPDRLLDYYESKLRPYEHKNKNDWLK